MAQIFVYIQISDCCDSIEVYYDTPYMEWNNFTIIGLWNYINQGLIKNILKLTCIHLIYEKKFQLLFTITNWIGITEFDSIQDA